MTDNPFSILTMLPILAGTGLIISILVYAAIDTMSFQRASESQGDDDGSAATGAE